MRKADPDWMVSDTRVGDTVVMNTRQTRSHSAVESESDVIKREKAIDEQFDELSREIVREDDIATAFTNVMRYLRENCVGIMDRCNFADFREFCLYGN